MNETTKRYLHSTAITFVAAFVIAFYPYLDQVKTLSELASGGTLAAVDAALLAGLRAVIKLPYEFFTKK